MIPQNVGALSMRTPKVAFGFMVNADEECERSGEHRYDHDGDDGGEPVDLANVDGRPGSAEATFEA